jgi:hypothetical protein
MRLRALLACAAVIWGSTLAQVDSSKSQGVDPSFVPSSLRELPERERATIIMLDVSVDEEILSANTPESDRMESELRDFVSDEIDADAISYVQCNDDNCAMEILGLDNDEALP